MKSGAAPSVSAMVVNFNGGDRILSCIEALRSQSLPIEEIVVVDNGSTDGSVRAIRQRFPDAEVEEIGGNAGISRARNRGLRRAGTDLVFSLDADMYVDRECLERLLETYLARGRPAVVVPRIVFYPERTTVQCDGAEIHFAGTLALRHEGRAADELSADAMEVGGCIGAALLLDRKKVLAAGGFDETYFFYFEDLEFSYRMRALGHMLICDSNAVVDHDRGAGTAGLSFRGEGTYPARRAYLTMRHHWLTVFIHYEARTMLFLLPVFALYETAGLVVSIMRGWIGAWIRARLWLLAHRGDIRVKRRSVQRMRVRRDLEILSGGPLPITRGFVRSGTARFALRSLSALLNGYWKIARRL
ncbi:MAG: glycosyltransferase family 2 protein [Candidatus Eisenbacteria bacterium]